jgi:hypothetical protein
MALTLQEISTVAAFFKKRVQSINEIKNVKIIGFERKGEFPIIKTTCGSQNYQQSFMFEGPISSDESDVKVNCTCASFKFEFAHVLNKRSALLNPDQFKMSILKVPKERNQRQVVMTCKHLIAASKILLKQLNSISNAFDKQHKTLRGVTP